MKDLIQIAGFLVVVSNLIRPTRAIGGICAQIVHGNFYDLGPLKSDTGYSLDIANAQGKVLFNMCQFLSFRCPGYNNSIAVYRSDSFCIPLTLDSITTGFNSSIIEKEDGKDEHAGIKYNFTGVVPLDPGQGNQSAKYNLQMILFCDPNKTENFVWDETLPSFNPSNGTITIFGRGATSCPKLSGSFIVEFFDRFSVITAIVAILIGIVQCFYGYRLYRPTVFLLGFLLAFMVIVLFLFEIWAGPASPSYKGYVIVIFAIITGILFGFLVAAVAWVAIVVSGAILGFFLSTFLYTLYLYKISSKPSNLLFYNVLVIGMVIGCIAGYEFQSAILILSCSFTGAYLIVRGISVFIGGFPSELNLSINSQVDPEEVSKVAYYIYLVAIILLTAAGIFVQKKLHSTDDIAEKEYNRLRHLMRKEGAAAELENLEAKDNQELEEPLLDQEEPIEKVKKDKGKQDEVTKSSPKKIKREASEDKSVTKSNQEGSRKKQIKKDDEEKDEVDEVETSKASKKKPEINNQKPKTTKPEPPKVTKDEDEANEGEEEQDNDEIEIEKPIKKEPVVKKPQKQGGGNKVADKPVNQVIPKRTTKGPTKEPSEGEEEGSEEQEIMEVETKPQKIKEDTNLKVKEAENNTKKTNPLSQPTKPVEIPKRNESEGEEEGDEEQNDVEIPEKVTPVQAMPSSGAKKGGKLMVVTKTSKQTVQPADDEDEIEWSEKQQQEKSTEDKSSQSKPSTVSPIKVEEGQMNKKLTKTKIVKKQSKASEAPKTTKEPEPVVEQDQPEAPPIKTKPKKKVLKKKPAEDEED